MNPVSGLLAPVLALLPAATAPEWAPWADGPAVFAPAELTPAPPEPPAPSEVETFADMARAFRDGAAPQQVRIEQRIIIRIAPGRVRSSDVRHGLFAGPAGRPLTPRLEERKMNQCLAVSGIAGVQPDGPSRLVMFMRDQRIVSASLEKACNAQDFYSGFLVERTSDGMICSGRDKLLSRSGSHCSLGKLRQLVQVDEDEYGTPRPARAFP